MKHEAKLKLGHNLVEVVGPPELVSWISTLKKLPLPDMQKAQAYDKYMQDWYVRCCVSGQKIRVQDLKYWNVETQEMFASASEALERHQERTTSST